MSYGALINDCLAYWDQKHIKYFPVFRPLLCVNMEVFFMYLIFSFVMIRFTVSAMSSYWSAGCTLILNWSHVNNFMVIFRPNWEKKMEIWANLSLWRYEFSALFHIDSHSFLVFFATVCRRPLQLNTPDDMCKILIPNVWSSLFLNIVPSKLLFFKIQFLLSCQDLWSSICTILCLDIQWR